MTPLDAVVDDPALTMHVVGDRDAVPGAVQDCQRTVSDVADAPRPIQALKRFAFHNRAATAFAVVQTGEHRLYGTIILKRGAIS